MSKYDYLYKDKCNCGSLKSKWAKRCLKCHNINQKNRVMTDEKKEHLRRMKVKHHKDLNRENNKKSNIMYLRNAIHRRLHVKAYNYLVEKGLVNKYISWFRRKYGL